MHTHDLVQRALRLLTQPKQTMIDHARKPSTVHPGVWIEWHRAGTTQQGLVDFLHEDADGTTWAFVTLGESWAAVNVRYATVTTDVTQPRQRMA